MSMILAVVLSSDYSSYLGGLSLPMSGKYSFDVQE